jgi:hypothetical protein
MVESDSGQGAKPRDRSMTAKRVGLGALAGGTVTAVVVPAILGLMNRGIEGETAAQRALVGLVAGLMLGAIGAIPARPLRGMVAGAGAWVMLLASSAVTRPAVGLAGELRSFDPGTIQGIMGAVVLGTVTGAIGGYSGGAVAGAIAPDQRRG